jgi:hypothetical protein
MEMTCLMPCLESLYLMMVCDVYLASTNDSAVGNAAQLTYTSIVSRIHDWFPFLSDEQGSRHGRLSNGAINLVASGPLYRSSQEQAWPSGWE